MFHIRFRPRFHTCCALLIAGAGLPGNPAMAADLIATKVGVMCVSTQALAQLTLPDGESRSHGDAATPAQRYSTGYDSQRADGAQEYIGGQLSAAWIGHERNARHPEHRFRSRLRRRR
jgi:hypothetical protein